MEFFNFYFGSIIFVLGLILGSFFNVCIYRIPKNLSIISPPSSCTHCNQRLKWLDLVPLLSFIFLKGRCRYCKEKISYRYFLVELLTGVLFLLIFIKLEMSFDLLIVIAFASIMILVTFIDIDERIIPDRFAIAGLILALMFLFLPLIPNIDFNLSIYSDIDSVEKISDIPFKNALFGGLLGGGFLLFVDLTGRLIFGKESMGMGDIKLMAWTGLILGVKGVIVASLFAIWMGAIVGVIILRRNAKKEKSNSYMPFGPFLASGSIIALVFANDVIDWYLSLM